MNNKKSIVIKDSEGRSRVSDTIPSQKDGWILPAFQATGDPGMKDMA